MRSNWSLERSLAVVAAAALEASWLTLAYLTLQWLNGPRPLNLGIVAFTAAATLGVVLSRGLRGWPRAQYAVVLLGATFGGAALGTLIGADAPIGQGAAVPALAAHPGGWLLGLALWRGQVHGEISDESELSESVMRGGVLWLIAFWLIATATRMVSAPDYLATAFVATLAFVGAGLVSLGLARIVDLEVESLDRGARRRWLILVVAVSVSLLVVALPVGAMLGLPVANTLYALAGPVAPILVAVLSLIAIPFALLAELLVNLLRTLLLPTGLTPPPLDPAASPPPLPGELLPGGAADLTWLGIVGLIALIAIVLMVAAALMRQPGTVRKSVAVEEVRESEPINFQLPNVRPRFRLRRARSGTPRNAIEAYRQALDALAEGPSARISTETPREHAGRLAGPVSNEPAVAADVRRLAADYQLAAFAGQRLSPAEERRAISRWRRIARRARNR